MDKYSRGTAVVHSDRANDRTGFILDCYETKGGLWLIGANGMNPISHQCDIVWTKTDGDSLDEVEEMVTGYSYSKECATETVDRWIAHAAARSIPKASEEALQAYCIEADGTIEQNRRDREAAAIRKQGERERFVNEAKARMPAWAKAVIIAEHRVDESDSMTDYWGSKTDGVLILGFSRHTRDVFSEMRKFAGNAEQTAHLATADKAAEHREKYSMGGGYYLKDGCRHSTGWQIEKNRLYNGVESIPTGQWCLSKPKQDTVEGAVEGETGKFPCHIEQHLHTKKRYTMHMVILDARVERDEFNGLRAAAKDCGGWYSRKWSTTPGGFAFESAEAAASFAASLQ